MGYTRMPIPAGLVPPMCFCGDPCKMEMSDEKQTFRRRNWMCANWAFDPPEKTVMKGTFVSNLLYSHSLCFGCNMWFMCFDCNMW